MGWQTAADGGGWRATAVVRPFPSMDLCPLLGDGVAWVEVVGWRRGGVNGGGPAKACVGGGRRLRRGGVDGEGPAKVVTSIFFEYGPVKDGGDDTCECVRPV